MDEFYEWWTIDDYKLSIWYVEDYSNPELIQKKIK
jgi:hypothetical protein